ncbi:MAG: 3-phosphoshikimate 1-carboxyvinyltransferase [Desulfovibrionales bacterium]
MKKSIQAPPSKSVSHRALISAALARGNSLIRSPLQSDDLDRTRECLSRLGAAFRGSGSAPVITGVGSAKSIAGDPVTLPVGESGTTCRLLAAVASAFSGHFLVSGTGRMHDRPIQDLTEALSPLGPDFEFLEKPGFPPFLIHSNGLSGGTTRVSLQESSQFLSGILLAAPLAAGEITVEVGGSKVVSWPYVGITLQVMQEFGMEIQIEILSDGSWKRTGYTQMKEVRPGEVRFRILPGFYSAREYQVEGDWSNASYFLAASALLQSPVPVSGLRRDSLQGDRALLDILSRMGATISWDDGSVLVRGGNLKGIDVDMGHCPDIVPTVAVLASMISGVTRIRNVAHLRIKESDRLMAVSEQLEQAGCRTKLYDDGIDIFPHSQKPGRIVEFKTYGDHRIAMSMSLFELAGLDVRLDNPGCVAKSFPAFWDKWKPIRERYAASR